MTIQHRRDVDDLASGRNDGYAEQLLRDRLAYEEEEGAVADRQEEPATDGLNVGIFRVWYRRSPAVPEKVERVPAPPDVERDAMAKALLTVVLPVDTADPEPMVDDYDYADRVIALYSRFLASQPSTEPVSAGQLFDPSDDPDDTIVCHEGPCEVVPAPLDVERLTDLLRRAKPHLYAVDRKSWCWCDITVPGTPHDPDCKWIADVERVGALRSEIENLLSNQPSTEPAQRDDCICPDDAGAHPECPYHNSTEPAQGGTG